MAIGWRKPGRMAVGDVDPTSGGLPGELRRFGGFGERLARADQRLCFDAVIGGSGVVVRALSCLVVWNGLGPFPTAGVVPGA